jgi:Zn-finger nucleic acid-binding protein
MRSEAEVAAMTCPVCKVPLSMSERQGIEIDYCPQCRGVWLDRGELDKIVERSAVEAPPPPAPPQGRPQPSAPLHGGPAQDPWGAGGYTHGGYGHGGGHGGGKPYYKKRKSWLEDIFD